MRLPNFSKSLPKRLTRLKGIPLFATLDPRELRIVDELIHEREFLEGEVIFDEGDEGQAIYLIFEGKVLICRQGRPVDGFIVELPAGTFLGEQALLDHAPRAAQARAASACKMGVLFRDDFQNLLDSDAKVASKIALQLARYLSRRLRSVVQGHEQGSDHL